jgi:hypothetical protein
LAGFDLVDLEVCQGVIRTQGMQFLLL